MTVRQLMVALDFAGGLVEPGDWTHADPETLITFQALPKRKAIDANEELPAGLYAWLHEYPDEGCTLLEDEAIGESESALRPRQKPLATDDQSHARIALNKLSEAFCATTDAERRQELIQLAAVALAWIQRIDRRPPPSHSPVPAATSRYRLMVEAVAALSGEPWR